MNVWGYILKYHDEDITYPSTPERENSNYYKLYIIIMDPGSRIITVGLAVLHHVLTSRRSAKGWSSF